MVQAAVAYKPAPGGKAEPSRRAPEAEAAPAIGTPAFLGGGARMAGGAPPYLQRQPMPIEQDEEPGDALLQRLPHDPFPTAANDGEDEDDPLLQAKLEINRPGDAFEAEADRVADRVAGGAPAPAAPRPVGGAPAVQRMCAECGGAQAEEEPCPGCAAKAQRKETSTAAPGPAPSAADAVAKPGPGTPLSDAVRGRIEPALGRDLSRVRVHSDRRAGEAAASINARAFTHGDHIWLGPGQSASDLALMAHEATHTVQQSDGGGAPALIQRTPSDHRHPEDGEGPRGRMDSEIRDQIGDLDPPDPGQPRPEFDPAEKNAKASGLEGDARPDVDRPAGEAPKVDAAAAVVEAEADKPGEPIAEGKSEADADAGAEGAAEAEVELGAVAQAMAEATALPAPEQPRPITPPEPVVPRNRDGEPVTPDFETEAMVQLLAGQIQSVRQGAHAMRLKARQEKSNAALMRGNIALVDQHVGEAESGLGEARGQLEFRRQVVLESENALATSEEKAAKVAAEAPGFESEADEAQSESGPMASEAADTSAENAANMPDDPDAAADAAEAGGQMDAVSRDSAAMDQAAGATKQRAVELQAGAAEAGRKNAETKGRIEEAKAAADQTEARFSELDGQAATARGQIDAVRERPAAIEAEADKMDSDAAAVIDEGDTLVDDLAQIQKGYERDVSRVPGSETLARENEGAVQRNPVDGALGAPERESRPAGYGGRANVDLRSALFGAPQLTEEQQRRQAEAQRRAEERRRARIARLEARCDGNFDNLSATDKAGIALGMMSEDLFGSVSDIQWPDFSWGGVGNALISALNPLGPLEGVLSGLSKVASGALNLFDMDQWARDPLGNLLKSAADIATGITIILGSIVALAGVVMAIMAALIVVTLGWATPVAMPVITFCGQVSITVGGWTISVGLLALYYQSLLFIKNLVDAMTAETAEELVIESEQMTEDTRQAGEIAMQVGQAALARMGGTGMADDIGDIAASAGGGAAARRAAALQVARAETLDGLEDAFIEGMLGEDLGQVYGLAQMGRGLAGGMRGRGRGDALPPDTGGTTARTPDAPAPDARTPDAPDAPTATPDAPAPDAPPAPPAMPPRNAAEAPRPGGDGETPAPRPDMEARPPDPAEPRSIDDAAAAPDAEGTGPAEGPAPETGATAPEGPMPAAEPTARGPDIPTLDAAAGGPDARPGGEAAGEADATLRDAADPDRARADAEGEADAARPRDDTASPERDPVRDAELRQEAAGKSGEDLSRDERAAEIAAVEAAPRRPVENEGLREMGFEQKAALDNGMEYMSSQREGTTCRVANTSCGGTGDGPDPDAPLSHDETAGRVDEALSDAGTPDGDGGATRRAGDDAPPAENSPEGQSARDRDSAGEGDADPATRPDEATADTEPRPDTESDETLPRPPDQDIEPLPDFTAMDRADLDAYIRDHPKGIEAGDRARFDRYRRDNGRITDFDEWKSASRGGRRGGPEHREIQNLLEGKEGVGATDSEVAFGDRFADAYWENGPDGKPVVHQIGGMNERGDPINRERLAIEDIRSVVGNDVDIWFWDKTNPNAEPMKNPDLDPESPWNPATR